MTIDIRHIAAAGLALAIAAGPAAGQESCDMNEAIALAQTVGNATNARLADGRLAPEDLNGPYGQQVNAANAAFAEGDYDTACAGYRALIETYDLDE